jgi:DnaJ-domain-containing protein 1
MGMGMGASRDALGEIEAKLRQAQQQQQQQQRGQSIDNDDVGNAEENRSMRLTRYGVEYRLKRPVENILKAYEKKPIHDLYAIIGIEESADATEVKFGYREMALQVHPDKNTHPKSKLAFDCLQEAYQTLASIEQRNEYDKKLAKLRSTKLRLHKFKRRVENIYHNSKSKVQLVQHKGDFYFYLYFYCYFYCCCYCLCYCYVNLLFCIM